MIYRVNWELMAFITAVAFILALCLRSLIEGMVISSIRAEYPAFAVFPAVHGDVVGLSGQFSCSDPDVPTRIGTRHKHMHS